MRKIALISLIFLALAWGSACGGRQATLSPSPTGVTVTIEDFAFHPNLIGVDRGNQVTWTNRDSVKHTVTGEGFDSGQLSQGQSFSRTFVQPGSYSYHCSIHPNMSGTVEVR